MHCSMMLRRVKIWSIHPLSFRNPACSSLSCLSIASDILCTMILARILLEMDKRVMPRQLLQLLRATFYGIFTMTPLVQSSGTFFSLHMAVKSGVSALAASSGSSLNSSALRLSCPGAFPFLRDLMEEMISSISGGSVSTSRSTSASCISASKGGVVC